MCMQYNGVFLGVGCFGFFSWCKLQSISIQIPPSGKFKLLNSLVKLQKIGKTTNHHQHHQPPTPTPPPDEKITLWKYSSGSARELDTSNYYFIRTVKRDELSYFHLTILYESCFKIAQKIKRLIHFKQILIQIQAKYHTHSF